MVTVPTIEGQTVAPKPVGFSPDDISRRIATPDVFGAYQARGLAQVGQGLGQDAQVASYIGFQQDERDAKAADVEYSKRILAATYGPGGFYSLKGEAAVNAQAGIQQQLTEAQKDIASNLSSPRARALFQGSAAQRLVQEQTSMARYGLQQRTVADNGAAEARISTAQDDASLRWNDPVAVARSADIIRGEVAGFGQRNGWTPEETAQHTKEQVSSLYKSVVLSAAANSPMAGAGLFMRLSGNMTAKDRVALAEHLRPKILAAKATADVEQDWATGGASDTGFTANVQAESGGKQFGPDGKVLTSPKGALGISQILPGTAQDTAAKHGIAFDQAKLETDPAYNLKLGSLYHGDLMDKYSGVKTLADAAYNAGPGNVDKWLKEFGDPRKGEIAMADFVAHIPLKETRDYVRKTGAAGGPVYPDVAGMQKAILARTAGDPELQTAELSRMHAKLAQFNVENAGARDTLHRQTNDIAAALEAGKDDTTIPYSTIRQTLPAPEAADLIGKLEEAKDAGMIYRQVQWASPQQLTSLRADLATGQGPMSDNLRLRHGQVTGTGAAPAPGTPEADAQFALRQRNLARFDTLLQKRNEALLKDPAAFAAQNPAVAAKLAAVDPSKPDTLQAAVNASYAAQRTLGVPEGSLRTLGNAQVSQIVQQLHSVDPEKGDMGKQLDDLSKRYGPMWGNVLHDLVAVGKLDPAYQALATMDQNGPRQNMQRALQLKAALGPEKFTQGPPPDQRTHLGQEVSDALTAFRQTTISGGARMFDETVQPAVTTLATYYATQGGTAADAAKRAYDEIIGSKYDIDGYTRTPKGQMSATLAAGDTLKAGLKDDQLGGGFTAAEAQRGVWMANPRGDGVVLHALKNGGYITVKDKSGVPIEMKFNALPKPGETVPGLGAAGIRQMGMDPRMQNTPVDQPNTNTPLTPAATE